MPACGICFRASNTARVCWHRRACACTYHSMYMAFCTHAYDICPYCAARALSAFNMLHCILLLCCTTGVAHTTINAQPAHAGSSVWLCHAYLLQRHGHYLTLLKHNIHPATTCSTPACACCTFSTYSPSLSPTISLSSTYSISLSISLSGWVPPYPFVFLHCL